MQLNPTRPTLSPASNRLAESLGWKSCRSHLVLQQGEQLVRVCSGWQARGSLADHGEAVRRVEIGKQGQRFSQHRWKLSRDLGPGQADHAFVHGKASSGYRVQALGNSIFANHHHLHRGEQQTLERQAVGSRVEPEMCIRDRCRPTPAGGQDTYRGRRRSVPDRIFRGYRGSGS